MTEEQPSLGNDGNDARNHDETETNVDATNHEQASCHTESTKDPATDSKDGVEEDDDSKTGKTSETGETGEDEGDDDGEEDEDEEEEDEEPKLKYARLTQHMGAAYRNGDATSAFLVAGDKMIVGTHNGNIVRMCHE